MSVKISKDLTLSDGHSVLKMLSLFLVILLVKVSTLSFKSSLCLMEVLSSLLSFVNLFLDVSFEFLVLVVKFGSLVGYCVYLRIENELLSNNIELLFIEVLLTLIKVFSHLHIFSLKQVNVLVGSLLIVKQ